MQDSDSEAVTINSVGLSNDEASEETEPAVQGHVRDRILECPAPTNRKRPRICLAGTEEMAPADTTNREGNATGTCCSVEVAAGPYEEDPKPSLVASSLLTSSDPLANRTSREGNARHSCCSAETDAAHDEEEPKPSLASRRVRMCSVQDEEVVQEETTIDAYLPPGWIRTKLEPDC